MKTMLTQFFCFLAFSFFAQTEKGASPLSPTDALTGSTAVTRAVVIGISDYQDPAIPDLRFADRDAEAFANYLRSPAGGSLDEDHLKILTNKAATTAQFDAALGWLIDESKEGDQAIIYFSGHGDVETKTRSQQGFLLCWDSPPQAYVSGAYPIFFLKEVVSTLSLENKARVIVITDACRSGKLAGNSIGGSQLTSQNLSQQFANEIKILSCQPNEYSIEGEQWGGGRGAFSYYLVDGLYGMADGNLDASVSLMEIGRYLEDHVTTEVAPQNQVPMTVGNRNEKLTAVVPEMLAQVRKNKAGQLPTFSPTDSRGIEEDVLATVDTTIREVYRLFKKALKDKVFLEPIGACADAYYEQLMAEPKMERLHNAMRRNYAAALQDDAQRLLNGLLKEEAWTRYYGYKTLILKYSNAPKQLEKAANLLGSNHYMFKTLVARKYLFESYIAYWNESYLKKKDGAAVIENIRKSLQYETDSPLCLNLMSNVYNNLAEQSDSAIFYAITAIELLPDWGYPYSSLGRIAKDSIQLLKVIGILENNPLIDPAKHVKEKVLVEYYYRNRKLDEKNYILADSILRKLIQIEPSYIRSYEILVFLRKEMRSLQEVEALIMKDSTNERLLDILTELYGSIGQHNKNEIISQKMIQLDSSASLGWHNLGWTYRYQNRYAESESAFVNALARDSFFELSWYGLARLYSSTTRYTEAEKIYERLIRWDSTLSYYWSDLGNIYTNTFRYDAAEIALKKAISLDSTDFYSWTLLGNLNLRTERFAQAEIALKKAVSLDSTYSYSWRLLGNVYLYTNRTKEAKLSYEKTLKLTPKAPNSLRGLANVYARNQDIPKALDYLRQSLEAGFSDFKALENDTDFTPLRSLPEWKELMKKYFPDQVKD